ncbi:MAG: hypothetical protein LBU86_02160, partial [Oscillospiraceae bacterium]|nr:hypothetical protein [Oscillospiraceae bacterium]
MSNSSNKTPVYGLNQWELTDKPKMEDFNYDNNQLELALNGLAETAEDNLQAIALNEAAIAENRTAIAQMQANQGQEATSFSIPTASWSPSTTYPDYPYEATISVPGALPGNNCLVIA